MLEDKLYYIVDILIVIKYNGKFLFDLKNNIFRLVRIPINYINEIDKFIFNIHPENDFDKYIYNKITDYLYNKNIINLLKFDKLKKVSIQFTKTKETIYEAVIIKKLDDVNKIEITDNLIACVDIEHDTNDFIYNYKIETQELLNSIDQYTLQNLNDIFNTMYVNGYTKTISN